jgi:glycosyltransferase involved in cell wall biosynthesis
MKICVYTIAKNEETFIERWFESAKDADELVIFDTGSSDKTVEISKKLGIKTIEGFVSPWRFDVARNSALSMVSSDVDYCVSLDADEVLVEGWRNHMETLDERITRPRYKYTWSWNEDGSEGLVYGGDKIHTRKGYVWKHPVHEVLTKTKDSPEVQGWIGLEIHHFPDSSKSRAQYGDMLEIATEEDPRDDRIAFYYGRELFYQAKYDQAYAQLKYHLDLPTAVWAPERAASKRLLAKCNPSEAEYWLLSAASEAPDRREPWVDLADYYYEKSHWVQCYSSAIRAISISEKPLEYICDAEAWGAKPYDLAAIAAYNLGMSECLSYGEQAVTINPVDQRLRDNLEYYKSLFSSKLEG